MNRLTRPRLQLPRLAALSLATTFALIAPAQEAPAPEPTENPAATAAPVKRRSEADLHALLLKEREKLRQRGGDATGSVLAVISTPDGTLEVRDSEGNLLESYPPDDFVISGKVATTAEQELNAARAAEAEALAERKKAEETAAEEAEKARKAEEEAKQKAEKEQEARWKADFAAKSEGYTDRKTRGKVNAVKIDARQIAEDGTYTYEGRKLKPLRLWNDQRKRYEMAIPVPQTEPATP